MLAWVRIGLALAGLAALGGLWWHGYATGRNAVRVDLYERQIAQLEDVIRQREEAARRHATRTVQDAEKIRTLEGLAERLTDGANQGVRGGDICIDGDDLARLHALFGSTPPAAGR